MAPCLGRAGAALLEGRRRAPVGALGVRAAAGGGARRLEDVDLHPGGCVTAGEPPGAGDATAAWPWASLSFRRPLLYFIRDSSYKV